MAHRNNISQKNTPNDLTWKKFFLGNFAEDTYPNPTMVDPEYYPDLLPAEEQARRAEARSYQRQLQDPSGMKLPGWGGNPRVATPTNLAEIYSRGPQGRGSNRPGYMPPVPRITDQNRMMLDPGNSGNPAAAAKIANDQRILNSFINSAPPPGTSVVAGNPQEQNQSLWDRFRNTPAIRTPRGNDNLYTER